MIEIALDAISLGELTTDDMAKLVAFLCSSDADHITGTELWIDPTRDLFLVFLTNRTFDPKVRNSAHSLRAIRTELSDAAIRLVPHACQQELVARC